MSQSLTVAAPGAQALTLLPSQPRDSFDDAQNIFEQMADDQAVAERRTVEQQPKEPMPAMTEQPNDSAAPSDAPQSGKPNPWKARLQLLLDQALQWRPSKGMSRRLLILAVAAPLATVFLLGIEVVGNDQRGVAIKSDGTAKALYSGIHWISPFGTSIHRFNRGEVELAFNVSKDKPSSRPKTADGQRVGRLSYSVYFELPPPALVDVADHYLTRSEVTGHTQQITPLARTVRQRATAIMSSYLATVAPQDLGASIGALESSLAQDIGGHLASLLPAHSDGITVQVLIHDIAPDPTIEAVIDAERRKSVIERITQ